MEDFILGLLMPNKLTAYELHQIIKNNYEGVCSHSIGNVQRALKKLHEKGFVRLKEAMDGKVVKKIFEITPLGRAQFMQWLSSPLEISKAKNMEIGKLLLLGFLSPGKRLEKIEGQIKELEGELEYLKAIETAIEAQTEEAGNSIAELQMAYIEKNKAYMEELVESVGADNIVTLLADISKFANLTLHLGLAEAKFNLEWFKKLRDDMLVEMKSKL